MEVTYTPVSGKGKAVKNATVVAVEGKYSMRSMEVNGVIRHSFFEEGIDGCCMVTKDNLGIYNALQETCVDRFKREKG